MKFLFDFTNLCKKTKAIVLFCCLCVRGFGGEKGDKPTVLTTIAPYAYIVERLAEGRVHVRTLVPPFANAHLFEPTPKDIEILKEARLWLRMGEGVETRLLSALKGRTLQLQIVELWSTLPLISEGNSRCCNGFDRHLWISPRMLRRQVPLIASALKLILPEHTIALDEHMHTLMEELEAKDQRFARLLKPKFGQTLVTGHPSFSYFCKDYGLKQLSIEVEGKEPLPQHLDALITAIKKGVIPRLFIQPQFSDRGAKQVAEKLKLAVYTVDPYGYNFLSNLDAFAQAIADAP